MAAFLSLLQELVSTHTGIARTRRPQVRTYLHLCHCKVHPLTRCERGRPSRSSAAAHFSDGGVPSIWVLCARPSYTTPTSGRCCFHFSSPELSNAHSPVLHLRSSPPRPGTSRRGFPVQRQIHVIRAGAGSSRREGACARPAVNKQCACAGPRVLSFVLHSKKKKGGGWGGGRRANPHLLRRRTSWLFLL